MGAGEFAALGLRLFMALVQEVPRERQRAIAKQTAKLLLTVYDVTLDAQDELERRRLREG